MTWGQILLDAKKNNHGILPSNLNKVAQNRLDSIHIEAADIYSLRLAATIRLYGYIVDNIFHIIWYDDNHGDNDTCVCRSNKKHT